MYVYSAISLDSANRAHRSIQYSSSCGFIAYDGFDYAEFSPLDTQNGGTGWTAAWTAQADRYEIQATNLTYSGLSTSGANAVAKFDNPSFANGFNRTFAPQFNRLWGSATISFAQVPTILELEFFEATNVNWKVKFGFTPSTIYTDHSGGGALASAAFSAATGTTYFVAFTYDTTGVAPTTFYLNPTGLGAGAAPTGSLQMASFTGTNWNMGGGMGGFNLYAANGLFTLDNVRVGTTWADVSPIPEPSTYALLALGLGALVFLRRRCKA